MAKINFKWPLRTDRDGAFNSNKTTIGAVREDLKTLLLTFPGERVIHSTSFGTNLGNIGSKLFDPSNVDELRSYVLAQIEDATSRWMPHVILQDVVVKTGVETKDLKENEVSISIIYSLINEQIATDSVQITVTL